jgi:hypothetical protein
MYSEVPTSGSICRYYSTTRSAAETHQHKKKKKHAVGTEETLVLATGTVESACMHLSLSPLSPAPYSQQEKKRVQFFFFKKSENFRIKYIYT